MFRYKFNFIYILRYISHLVLKIRFFTLFHYFSRHSVATKHGLCSCPASRGLKTSSNRILGYSNL
ncbi:hypothetical protein HanXRQr2_Chr12g0548221 [Helianthus annuus]|uniref:Uncharacterized protein n=1 Tax=Helianthus annuus TaxID=4232 RepID=A0A9K3HHN7_HELAN|nr:hypothetical protein HanXRQr2_Chr12g0548221 [Helianthus annuus]KAJ0863242.1 hypothetical protein HanPSC8_Chr12g0527711 [Helianthus annuus]